MGGEPKLLISITRRPSLSASPQLVNGSGGGDGEEEKEEEEAEEERREPKRRER